MYQYEENLPPDAKSRYQKKIEAAGILQCPYKEPAVRWINEPKKWPPTTYKDVYHYLIKSPRKFFSFVYLPQFLSADWIWKGGGGGGGGGGGDPPFFFEASAPRAPPPRLPGPL